MSEPVWGMNSIADRRYYHFVAMKGIGVGPQAVWRKLNELGDIERPMAAVLLGSSRFKVEHRKFRLKKAYARGATGVALSEHGNGRAPFLYDLFAARIDCGDYCYLILGFPFAALARETIGGLESVGFMKHVELQGVDMSEFLSAKNRPLEVIDGLSSSVVGVQFVVTDDKSLTAVRLGGDDPFQAEIYESFLRKKFEAGVWIPDQCVLACERKADMIQEKQSKSTGRLLRSRLHIDTFGNFKFYMHLGCGNVTLLPYAISQIHSLACLRKVDGNPLNRIEQQDGS